MPLTCPQCSTASVKHVIPVYICARYPWRKIPTRHSRRMLCCRRKRCKHTIPVLSETTTSYTVASMVPDEKSTTLRKNVAHLCLTLRPLNGPIATVRVDPAPDFAALKNGTSLQPLGISVDAVRIKNVN
jgi:hypothetical protein